MPSRVIDILPGSKHAHCIRAIDRRIKAYRNNLETVLSQRFAGGLDRSCQCRVMAGHT